MLKDNKANIKRNIVKIFQEVDTYDFPAFNKYKRPLERALWVLWVAKEKLGIKALTAEQIASIIRDVEEVSIEATTIAQSFKRAGRKIHVYLEGREVLYEIMREGREHLLSLIQEGSINVFCFEPEQRFTSKRLLTENILKGLDGELRIVDPYCGERTLDCLKDIKDRQIRFLTRMENLPQKSRDRFERELQDFKSEYPDIEFRDYPSTDLHDRYIISLSSLVILGHSIKDLGGKESFAIVLNKETSKNVFEALSETFDRRWKQSAILY